MKTQAATREIIAPVTNPETEPFWQAARESRLALRLCNGCSRFHYYPRAYCPHCMSDAVEWRDAGGGGRIHAHTVMRRAPVPYAVAYVELDEGPLMLTNIVAADLDALRTGDRVRLCFDRFGEGQAQALPVFAPEA